MVCFFCRLEADFGSSVDRKYYDDDYDEDDDDELENMTEEEKSMNTVILFFLNFFAFAQFTTFNMIQ